MQLAILTAVLAAIAAAEGGGGPVEGVSWRLWAIFAAELAPPLAALVGGHRLTRDREAEDHGRSAARLESIVIALWLGAVAFILLVGQWPRIVRANWDLAALPLVDEIAILLPVIAPLILIWAAMYRLQGPAQTNDTQSRDTLLRYILLQARHHLALVLLPPLAVVGLIESASALKIAKDLDAVWWFAIPQLAIVLLLMPLAVRRLWRTTPLVLQPLRGQLDELCESRGTVLREILVWQTDGTMANAAVVGMSRYLRYLLLTDVLLSQLTADQIAAVVRHELAHLRRWHLPLRLALLLLPVAWWMAFKQTFPDLDFHIASSFASLGLSSNHATAIALPLLLLAYAVLVVGWYSRLLEHDADVDACLDDNGQFDCRSAVDFCTALTTLCGDAHESWFSRWLHPSVSARVGLLNHIAFHPTIAVELRRRMTTLAIVIALLYVAAGGLLLLG
ncbi:MAG TPA: M48 family metalloprotease [Pirellulaceae bacterium]|jgi:Zn-dependent protease with chaperone function